MLSEEAVVLFAATGACALLILGVLELVTPTRPRRARRRPAPAPPPLPAPVRDPWRRARTSLSAPRQAESPVAAPGAAVASVEAEPPIERLLLSEAATLNQPPAPPRPPVVTPLPPPRQPAGFDFLARRPAVPAPVVSPAAGDAPPPDAVELVAPDAVAPVAPPVELWTPGAPPVEPVSRPTESAPADALPVETVPGPAFEAPTGPAPPPAESFVAFDDRDDLAAAMTAALPPAESVPVPGQDEQAPSGSTSAVDRCYALYEARQYREALSEAVPVLESAGSGTLYLDPRAAARLWGLVGLARQAIGDHEGARTAFEEAIGAASAEERATWQRHLGGLALHVGQQLMTHAQNTAADAEQRVTTLRSAIVWLDGGLAASPNDPALREVVLAARSTLWPTYEQVAGELIQRQDYNVARRLLRQALADEECPAAVQATLRELLATTYSGEVGQLTAEAIRKMQEGKEDDAVATLDRAEALLATIPEEGVPDKRRQELERRLWWSYTKVGMRRLDGGMYEEALGPLLHALHFGSVGPGRLEETKRPLARALESIAEVRSPLIHRLAAEGDRDGALLLCEKLWTFLRRAMDRGMTREELATSLDRTQALFEKLGKPRK
ncbi:MAG: hypothetical protein ACREM3_04360 [Candidatus Rokuibacteriota bacterium]